MTKESPTGGVKPMAIAGRTVRERERLLGMTEEERNWRAQWLKDQHLTQNEPKHVPELYAERYNIIRRIYRAPLDKLETILAPSVGPDLAMKLRYFSGKIFLGVFILLGGTYYFKYNGHDWTRAGGWKVMSSRKSVLPGDPNWPEVSNKQPSDYASFGFKSIKQNL